MLLTSSDQQVSFIFTNTSQKVSALNKANFRLHFRPCSTAGEGEKKKDGLLSFDYFNRFLSNRCVFDCFVSNRYLVSGFIASNYESRVLIDPC